MKGWRKIHEKRKKEKRRLGDEKNAKNEKE